jgi:hypothetical protein
MRTMQEALEEAERYKDRCEALAALLVQATGKLEQARAEQAERARAAAEAEAAEAAAEAVAEAAVVAQRHQMEQELAALNLRVQQVQAQLGVVAPAPQPEAEEALCVVCMDAPKQYAIMPCRHVCACEACAQRLLDEGTPCCPVCRGPLEDTMRVFF